MLFVVSDDEGQHVLLCQIIKARASVLCLSDDEGQGGCCLLCQIIKARERGCCLLCQIMKTRVSVVCCVLQ